MSDPIDVVDDDTLKVIATAILDSGSYESKVAIVFAEGLRRKLAESRGFWTAEDTREWLRECQWALV